MSTEELRLTCRFEPADVLRVVNDGRTSKPAIGFRTESTVYADDHSAMVFVSPEKVRDELIPMLRRAVGYTPPLPPPAPIAAGSKQAAALLMLKAKAKTLPLSLLQEDIACLFLPDTAVAFAALLVTLFAGADSDFFERVVEVAREESAKTRAFNPVAGRGRLHELAGL